jgi:hypothetical protein
MLLEILPRTRKEGMKYEEAVIITTPIIMTKMTFLKAHWSS